jgi:hypothetical protein
MACPAAAAIPKPQWAAIKPLHSRFISGRKYMSRESCLLISAVGRQLDLLRGEASRVAKDSKVGWWTEGAERGMRFCFEDAKAKDHFAVICDKFGVPSQNG